MTAKTGWDDAIDTARRARNNELASRLRGERRVVRELVKAAMKRGYFLRVFDGEEYVTFARPAIGLANVVASPDTFSAFKNDVMAKMFSTDEDIVHVYKLHVVPGVGSGVVRIAWFHLVYGNSAHEVIADYSANEASEDILKDLRDMLDSMETRGL